MISFLVIFCLLLSPIASGAILLDSSFSAEKSDSQSSYDHKHQSHQMVKDLASSIFISEQSNKCDHSSSCSLYF